MGLKIWKEPKRQQKDFQQWNDVKENKEERSIKKR